MEAPVQDAGGQPKKSRMEKSDPKPNGQKTIFKQPTGKRPLHPIPEEQPVNIQVVRSGPTVADDAKDLLNTGFHLKRYAFICFLNFFSYTVNVAGAL